jgi:hypothetical protein
MGGESGLLSSWSPPGPSGALGEVELACEFWGCVAVEGAMWLGALTVELWQYISIIRHWLWWITKIILKWCVI